ncbi:RDD family protein [Sulfitobacter albidus]|uniref:RDD family protein n=1 Tax=Sulfitobacter albidus TaxID=2829501 RepID=A0A975JBK1_9RHOB|nr:RDD family protein [Sulfitobacter albidus]QUJ75418.1 RDD family protein [Sulfitobacter albidus]
MGVDALLVSLLTTLLLLPFLRPDETRLRLSGGVSYTQCLPVKSISQELADLVAPSPPDAASLCTNRSWGLYNGRTLTIIFDRRISQDGAVTTSSQRSITVALDGSDSPTTILTPQSALNPLVLMLASALLLARRGRTPGKRLTGLRITGQGCAMCREVRRLGPFVLLGIGSTVLSVLPPDSLADLPPMAQIWVYVGGGVIVLLAFVWLYVWPLLRWRGAMPYDRATGFRVVSAR